MKCLVTGATGYTGKHLAFALQRSGHAVRALVRPGSAHEDLARAGIELSEGQLTRPGDVETAARGCDQIYHIAAVFRTAGHPASYYHEVNVGGTVNVLEAARKLGCERVVHCSTGGVHGHVRHPPANETQPPEPDDVYQVSKAAAEVEANAAIARGQPVVIFRPGAIYGEGDLRFLKLFRAVQNRRFVMVGSGAPRLHMVYVDDLVAGIQLCGTRPEALGQTFLLAGPDAPTLNEIVAMTAEIVGVPRPRLHVPVWPVYAAAWACEMACVPFGIDPPLHRRRVGFFTHNRHFDIGKAVRMLGYSPQIHARQGIERAIRWYVANGLMAER